MKGFTLIEMIIYCSLFSFLLFGMLNASSVILSAIHRNDFVLDALERGAYVIHEIDAAISKDFNTNFDVFPVDDFTVVRDQAGTLPPWVRVSFTIDSIPFSIIRYSRI